MTLFILFWLNFIYKAVCSSRGYSTRQVKKRKLCWPTDDPNPKSDPWSGCVLRQHLLVHTARSEGYSKVMLGDNCTRLAIKLLTSISLGRGAQLAQDTVSGSPFAVPQDAGPEELT